MLRFKSLLISLSLISFVANADIFDDGMTAFKASKYQTALSLWQPLAEQGHIIAQLQISQIYLKGLGRKKNTNLALSWLNKAVALGSSDAEFKLGEIYVKGNGVEVNFEKSVEWFLKAAEQGHAKAQYQLGVRYFKGEGVPMDYQTSYAWMDLSAKQGLETSNSYRDMIGSVLEPSELDKAKQLAAQLSKKYSSE